ncbi:hypothetical protein [Streptomyces sp. NPDC048057]|uniref:hypothetical protein n=1 Tax=Streptomyces sp. NPDC048057 TaxID=3155628 RepID=UPI0033C1874F
MRDERPDKGGEGADRAGRDGATAADEALRAVLAGGSARGSDPEWDLAARDVATLREQLHLIGDALATAPPAPKHGAAVAPRPRRGRRVLALAASVAALTTVATLAVVVQYRVAVPSDRAVSNVPAGQRAAESSGEGVGLCTRRAVAGRVVQVAEGTEVPKADGGGSGRFNLMVTLAVDRHLTPREGPDQVVLKVVGTADAYPAGRRLVVVATADGRTVSLTPDSPQGRSLAVEEAIARAHEC